MTRHARNLRRRRLARVYREHRERNRQTELRRLDTADNEYQPYIDKMWAFALEQHGDTEMEDGEEEQMSVAVLIGAALLRANDRMKTAGVIP